ncbi:unnamed protein product [Paramecium pentaurelia]|uniref:Uncharacterized protein n=1 Tax=Paramecium pentaurelia TaxID=43138 RepID=A0A8S1TWL6_9CILI|nr:unnamed protein product [Paramecium pentaurelia]
MMFFKRRQELEQKLIQAENENKQQKYIKEKQEDKNYQYQLTIDEKLEKIRNLEYEIKKKTQDINDQKYMIQKKEDQLKQKEDQIIDLNQNLKALQLTIKKNNEIFQQTILEVKQMSSKAIIKLEIEKGWKVFKNADGKLKEIVKKEQDIKENTIQINQEVDELLILIKNNPNDKIQEEKRQSIMKKFQDVKNTIKSVKEKLEEIIKKQNKAWGCSARIADTEQIQSVKLNLEAITSYSKLFDHLFQVVTYLVEQSIEYQQQDSEVLKQQSSIALKITNNRNFSNNYSIVVKNMDSQNDRQLLYANIATQSYDTSTMKDNNSQTDNDIPLNQAEDIFVNSVTQSPTKNHQKQKCRHKSQSTSKFKTEQAN